MDEIQAEWQVPADHPALAGHFPDRPMVPGVLLLDRALRLAEQAQGAGIWLVIQAKFLQPVTAGDRVHLRLAPHAAGGWSFEICCRQHRVATGLLRQEAAA